MIIENDDGTTLNTHDPDRGQPERKAQMAKKKKNERAKLLRSQKRMLKLYPSLKLKNGTLHVGSKPIRKARPSSAQLAKRRSQADSRALLESIADLMSGHEWNADTLDAIAQVLINAGYPIEEPK